MSRPAPAAMVVYYGMRALGEIEDHGSGDVRAWVGTGSDRVALGTYPDRRTAMRAVSAADRGERTVPPADLAAKTVTEKAFERLNGPVGFVSGLPDPVGGKRQ